MHANQEPPPFLHRNRPGNPRGTPFLHRNPPASHIGTILGTPPEPPSSTGTPFVDPFLDPSWTLPEQEPPPSCAGTPLLYYFLSPFVTGILRTSLQADVDVYPRLVLKSVDEEERAASLPVAPSEAARTVDGRAPSLQDPPTWLLQSTLTITDMHSPVTRQGSTLWYRDSTPTVSKGKAATALQLRLPVASTHKLAELPQGHAGHGKTYVVA